MNACVRLEYYDRLPRPEAIEPSAPPILTLVSRDFPTVRTVSATIEPSLASKVLGQLRYYAGAALLGSVVCGLAFGWTEYREVASWVGSGVALLAALIATPRRSAR